MATRRRMGTQYTLIAPDGSSKLALDDSYRQAVMSIEGVGLPPGEFNTIRGYQFPGETVQSINIPPRTITLEWLYLGKDVRGLNTMRDRLIDLVRYNRNSPMILRQVRPDGRRRDIYVYIQSGPEHGTGTLRGNHGMAETLALQASDPLFFDPTLTSVPIDDVATSGFGFPYGFPYSYGPAGFLGKNITYTGTALSYPVITITGPFSGLTITHLQTKANIFVKTSLSAGRTLTIDLNPYNVTFLDDLGNSYLDYIAKSDLVNFALFPPSEAIPGGVNGFTVSGGGNTGATTVTFTYYERFLSL